MKSDRKHAGINGTEILESLSANAFKNYLGSERAQSIVFGTSGKRGFAKQVSQLCKSLNEGGKFHNPDKRSVTAQDGKLDVVAWVPFSDFLPSQIIIFAQCKTGTNWRGSLSQLDPTSFCKKWFFRPLIVNPMRAFCVAEAADQTRWNSDAIDGVIFFDRCRLVDFSMGLENKTFRTMSKWTKAAFRSFQLIDGIKKSAG
jgi:hypothetical protein